MDNKTEETPCNVCDIKDFKHIKPRPLLEFLQYKAKEEEKKKRKEERAEHNRRVILSRQST